jgi:hypothetical protein
MDLYFRLQSECKALGVFLGFTHTNCEAAYRKYKETMRDSCQPWDDFFASPSLNTTTALYMFSFLRSENSSKNVTSVTFRAGDWSSDDYDVYGADFFIDGRKNVVYCSLVDGREVCEAQGGAYGEWEWDGERWIVYPDFEDYETAEYEGDVEEVERIREKMRRRLESFSES